jgi:hypothetical protein
MPRRVCTTQPGDGACCRALSSGIRSGQSFKVTLRNGSVRCASCTVVASASKDPRKHGRPVFQFRFHKSQECGIGPSGCAALAGQAGGQSQLTF